MTKATKKESDGTVVYDRLDRHVDRLGEQYIKHVKESPEFADRLQLWFANTGLWESRVVKLKGYLHSELLSDDVKAIDTLLQLSVAEAQYCIDRGDAAEAVEKCYEAVSILLRVVDVLNGEQRVAVMPVKTVKTTKRKKAGAVGPANLKKGGGRGEQKEV